MTKRVIVFLFVVAAVVADPARAGDYELIKGKDVEVCEVCLENLRRQPVEEAVCNRQYKEELGLHAAQWNELDLKEHVEFYKRVTNWMEKGDEFSRNPSFDDPKNFEGFMKMAFKYDRMALATINVDNDGKPEHLLQWSHGTCRNMFTGFFYLYASAILVLTDDQRTIDRSKSDLVLQNIGKTPSHPGGTSNYQLYNVFTYKDVTYFDKWDGGGGSKQLRADTNTLSVYQVTKGQTNKVCQIRLFPVDVVPHK